MKAFPMNIYDLHPQSVKGNLQLLICFLRKQEDLKINTVRIQLKKFKKQNKSLKTGGQAQNKDMEMK